MTTSIPVTIIGAGQAGLAMSRCLTDRSIDHVVLERGEVANAWRSERWDSLRLLTPNWMTRLPHHRYEGDDPDGYMTAVEVAGFLDGYGRGAPVRTNTTVESVRSAERGFTVTTDQGVWTTRSVVVATGACGTPRRPAVADLLPSGIRQLDATGYRRPDQLDDGRVLVVGASASGAQIADELQRSGRDVLLAVGDHTRLPRTYRGMDIHWWMHRLGLLDERYDEVEDLARARRVPSLQLIGTPERRSIGLDVLHAAGVQMVGRFAGIAGSTAQFSGSLANQCASADLKLGRLLDSIDEHATATGLDTEVLAPDRPGPTDLPPGETTLDLGSISTVVWATGFRPDYPWLEPHLLDRKGAIAHDGGVMQQPGMYVLGLPFLRRRKSSFIDGVGQDAIELSEHLSGHLDAVAVGRC
ncbi:MAG: NAD(P)-binding domain-containing protein [Actinomycetota bacterium]